MIEEKFSLRAEDAKDIYFVLNKLDDKPCDRVIVIGHGLTGHIDEALHHYAKTFFIKDGNAHVARLSFYSADENARNLSECTVDTHARDLNQLVAHLSQKYSKVFYVGHSYGGLTALLANPDVVATCFWDSTYLPAFWDTEAQYNEALDAYIIGWGVDTIASKAMVEEAKALTAEAMKQKAADYKSPACVVLAGANDESIEGRQKLFDDLPNPKKQIVIADADHCFTNGLTVYELLSETANWFAEF